MCGVPTKEARSYRAGLLGPVDGAAHRAQGAAVVRRLILLLLLAVVAWAGCTTNPATGKKQLNVLSPEDEVRLGTEAAPQFLEEYGGELPSEKVNRYVRRIGKRLARRSERPDLPWKFYVVDSKVINAFALPGGKVFISRGLLEKLDNEAQLAGVLGHEVGHVTAKHINDRMTQALGVQLVTMGFGVATRTRDENWLKVLGVGTQVGGTLYLLRFSRDQEIESDELGVRYMSALGYNPVGQLQVMRILHRESAKAGQGGGPQWMSTHPLPETRIENLDQLIRDEYPCYDDPARYQMFRDRFQNKALAELEKLPPARHPPKQKPNQKPKNRRKRGVVR